MNTVGVVFVGVVLARFMLPLLIPAFPLPAIVGCLVLDGVDQTIFQIFGYDPPWYQGYDKAMDVYYLAIAYLATLRNWSNLNAFRIGHFLYFYRLVGVVAFELTHVRALLLIFPNTFESSSSRTKRSGRAGTRCAGRCTTGSVSPRQSGSS